MQFMEAAVDLCWFWERTSGSQRIFGEWKAWGKLRA